MSAIIYLLQVSACMAIFYGFYYFLLSKLTFFTINRYYLLCTLLLSFVIPLLTIHLHQQDTYPTVMRQAVYVNTLQNIPVYIQAAPLVKTTLKPTIGWLQLLEAAYFLAAAVFFTHLVIALAKFFQRLKHGKIDRIGNVNILRGNKNLANGSFLNYIFLNDDELSPDEMQQIIAHEMLHVKLLHSVDRIIAKIAQIILWFNPFIYLYARSIEENHEFEVDREIARNTDKNNYADLLLHLSIAKQGMLYHSFSKVPLKKRIVMLFNKPSSGLKRVVYVLIIPVIVISCLTFAHLIKDKKQTDKKQYSVIAGVEGLGENPIVSIDGKIYDKDILYKISKSCIKGSSSGPGHTNDIKRYGPRAKDGVITIKTKNGIIVYMTPIEKENLMKEAAVPKTRFFTRLVLKKENGKFYDKIIINQSGMSETSDNEHNAKVAFFIDGKRYTEDYIKNLSPAIVAILTGEGGIADPKTNPKKWPNTADCESVIYFTSIKGGLKDMPALSNKPESASLINYGPLPVVAHKVKLPIPIVVKNSINNFNPVFTTGFTFPRRAGVFENANHLKPFVVQGATTQPAPNNESQASNASNTEAYDKLLASITDKIQLFNVQNSIAWNLAVNGKNLDWAEKISKQSIDVVNDLLEHPVPSQFGDAERTRKRMKGYTFMVGDTYAYILYKEGKYAEALKVQQPLYDRSPKNGPVVIHYVQILVANGNYTLAEEIAENAMQSEILSIEILSILKEIYIKINGSDEGFGEYIKGLRSKGITKQVQANFVKGGVFARYSGPSLLKNDIGLDPKS